MAGIGEINNTVEKIRKDREGNKVNEKEIIIEMEVVKVRQR